MRVAPRPPPLPVAAPSTAIVAPSRTPAPSTALAVLEDPRPTPLVRFGNWVANLGRKLIGRAPIPLVSSTHPEGVLVHVGERWLRLDPSTNYKLPLPSSPRASDCVPIPRDLQRGSATHGSFVVHAMQSQALGRRHRVGVYFPPGYDPAAATRYPVLVLLPGRGNPLHYWTSSGRLIPKLNRMMAGDAQKMIVLIPDNTDSFWVDEYERFTLDELLGFATRELRGDAQRLSIGGISRGGFGATSMALRHPGKFASVSSHAGMLNHGPGPTPLDLVNADAPGIAAARFLVDVGAHDSLSRSQALIFGEAMQYKGAQCTVRVLEGAVPLRHNWRCWEPSLEQWIAFHQAAHGKPGVPTPRGLIDATKKVLAATLAAGAELAAAAAKEKAKKAGLRPHELRAQALRKP